MVCFVTLNMLIEFRARLRACWLQSYKSDSDWLCCSDCSLSFSWLLGTLALLLGEWRNHHVYKTLAFILFLSLDFPYAQLLLWTFPSPFFDNETKLFIYWHSFPSLSGSLLSSFSFHIPHNIVDKRWFRSPPCSSLVLSDCSFPLF